MQSHGVQLAANASADGSYKTWPGGKSAFLTEATWGGGNVKLQTKGSNGGVIDLATHSANAMTVLDLPPGQYRVAVTTATVVYADLVRIPE